jgi:hypothetical protein
VHEAPHQWTIRLQNASCHNRHKRDILRQENNSINPALLQLNCSCKHNIVAQSKSHF